jgi:DNA-binding MarR family transcriptional regulator
MGSKTSVSKKREELFAALAQEGRRHSTATILFHHAIGNLLGLNGAEHKYVEILWKHGSMTAGEFAELAGLTSGAVTGIIDRLEKSGLVRRVKDANDRRRVIVEIVRDPRKEEEVEKMFKTLLEPIWQILQDYSNDQLETILDFMRKSQAAMAEAAEMIRGREKGEGK